MGCPCRPEEERLRLLKGTGVPEAVEKDLVNIRSEYYSIVLPFMEAHSDLFSPSVRSLELYQQLVALVMAYSFQEPLEEDDDEKEPNSPLMVPAADILNHIANHNANLEYSAVSGPLSLVRWCALQIKSLGSSFLLIVKMR